MAMWVSVSETRKFECLHRGLYGGVDPRDIELFPSSDRFCDSPQLAPAPMKDTLNVLLSKLRMKQLQLLIALDDLKSLHKAAGAMAMTQSAASKALQELESMLEAPLFERS